MLKARRGESGQAMMEAALVLMPLMALALAIVDFSMPIFLKSTFTHAVREGCRFGITYNLAYGGTNYASQTQVIKAVVQANSMGFLSGPTGANHINVAYYSPVPPFGQVSGNRANATGNILVVSIQGYSWNWMVPMWRTANPLSISATSADRLETLPPGSALPTP